MPQKELWMLVFCAAALLGLGGCAQTGPGAGRPSLHTLSIGSKVAGSFAIADKVVYMPDGNWTLAVAKEHRMKIVGTGHEEGPKIALVYIAEVRNDRMVRGTFAAATESSFPGLEQLSEPCKPDDSLFKLDLRKTFRNQFCVAISANSKIEITGPGTVKIPTTMISVKFTRYAAADTLLLRFDFDPQAYGFAGGWSASEVQRDAKKSAFIERLKTWATAVAPWVEYGYDGESEPATPFPPAPVIES